MGAYLSGLSVSLSVCSPPSCSRRRRPRPEASFFFVPAVRTAARQVLRDLFYGAKERTRGYFTPQISGRRDRRRAAAEGQGEKVLISARHPPRRRSVGRTDRVASFADRAPFFDHPQIPFAPSLTRLSKRFGDVMSAAASPSFPSFPSLRGNYVRMARAQVPLFGDH